MKKKIVLILFLSFGIFSLSSAQEIIRSTIGAIGSSSTMSGETNYLVQQSIGQASVIGKFQSNGINSKYEQLQ